MTKMIAFFALFLLQVLPAQAQENVSSVDVQLAVQDVIKKRLVNGTLAFIDFDTQKVLETVPLEAHPMIFKGDSLYVACITVASAQGEEYPVDIYLLPTTAGLRLAQMNFGYETREKFKKIVASGFVERFN